MSCNPGQRADLPEGVWAIASHANSLQQVDDFISSAETAACWCWRRPQLTGAQQQLSLKKLTAIKPVFTHGLFDWAAACSASGVICGVNSLPPSMALELHSDLFVGASVHSLAEAKVAIAAGVHFLLYGPVYDTPSKQDFLSARGLDALSEVAASGIPVVALGGIEEPAQVEALQHHGAHSVAVLRASRDASLMRELCAAFVS